MSVVVQNKSDLELSRESRDQLFEAVHYYTETFLDNLPQQKAYIGNQYERSSEDNRLEIDGTPHPINQLLDLIHNRVDCTGLNPASGGHFGYIPGGGIYTASLGDYIAAITNRFASVFYASPGATRIENALIKWVGNLVGYKKEFGGNITSGGSIANLIALSVAKTAKKIKSRNVEKSVIYTTLQSHHSIMKALRLMGLDECVIRYVALDKNFRMEVLDLEKQIQKDKAENLNPFLIVANAGSTDVGAVDDLKSIAAIAQKENLWLHVDAAYGGFFLLTEYGKEKLKGIEMADSVILDPHKSLFLPYGTGMVLVKEVKYLREANSYEAGYMLDAKNWSQELSPTDLSPEMSRNFRGMRMWLPLQLHGIKPFEDCLNEKLELIRYFCDAIQQGGFEVGVSPDLTVAIYRYSPKHQDRENFNRNILKKIIEDGRVFISSTVIHGEFWLRIVILSFRTHKREVDILIGLLQAAVNKESEFNPAL
ncbi:MAG: aminotransferase class I/II-fold pyridoxal phosphate-dependent enzyme [Bacteroidetes bacterium]|nr:aminotransferase class I/II-fold pyridoxal phosphate-dependent enzyme [Bacteroidota bacterium]